MWRASFTWMRAAVLLLSAALLVALPATAAAKTGTKKKPKKTVVGAFYTETNGNPNKLLVFSRYSDGTLKKRGAVATGVSVPLDTSDWRIAPHWADRRRTYTVQGACQFWAPSVRGRT